MQTLSTSRQSFKYLAFEALKRGILAGVLPSGSLVIEERVANDLGLSRTPVREALGMLEVLGLINRRPSRGFEVRGFTQGDLVNLTKVRTLLEEAGIADACRYIQDDDVEHLTSLLEQMEAAAPFSSEFRTVHKEFHRAIHAISGNPFLLRAVDPLLDLVELAWEATSPGQERHERARRGHRTILETLRAHDQKAAVAAIREHIAAAQADMSRALEELEVTRKRPPGLKAVMEEIMNERTEDTSIAAARNS